MRPHPLSPDGVYLVVGQGLDPADYIHLSDQAKNHQKVERWWKRKFREAILEAAGRALTDLAMEVELDPTDFDFESLVVENAIEAMRAGLKKPRVNSKHLAGPKPGLKRIFQMWDQWRKKPSKAQQKNADHIKKTFLHTVKEFWKTHSADFRRGAVYDLEAVKHAFREKAAIPIARADTIVQTETCRFYVSAIETMYKNVPSISHYLFAAILDKRTTKFCTDFTKGGRHGLIYTKGTILFEKNSPPCHWNCRSTILPLSLSNPRHRKLIEDQARQAENRSPAPLPRGWNA